jgi:cytochrome c-type biogenesis protein CcmF
MTDVGFIALCLTLVAAGYAAVASAIGGGRQHPGLVRSGENALLAVCGLLTLAVLALWYALLTHNFQVQYVAETSNRSMPLLYVVSALWGGQNGSLLFWGWILSLYSAATVLTYRDRHRVLMPWVVAVLASTSFFFTLIHLFAANPFELLPFTPQDGRGLNPLLQHPVMAIHPPTLYLGMVGMVVPFAFALAALITRQLDDAWLRPARRWTLIPWTFLGVGLLLGGKWAYVELGWGGYWGWDPVENSSLMPWLSATAFLHSIMIQERKGMLKVWNMVLAVGSYALCIFGTFITRSGVITSVHAFAQSNIGPFFATYLIILLVVAYGLLLLRRPLLKAENRLESFASRETAFLLNNWILLGILFAVLWGTVFPLLSGIFMGDQVTVGPPFFNRINIPLGLVLLFLTGAGPLFAWRRTSVSSLWRHFAVPVAAALGTFAVVWGLGVGDFYALVSFALCAFVTATVILEYHSGTRARQRSTGEGYLRAMFCLASLNRRRYGGYVVHISVVLLFVGFTGKAFTTEKEFVLRRGETTAFGEYLLTYETLARSESADCVVSSAAITLARSGSPAAAGLLASGDPQDGSGGPQFLATLLPARHYYPSFDQGTTEVSIYSTWREDLYLILVGFARNGASAKFQIYRNPLVNFVWLGGIAFVLGSLWALWPSARDRRLAALDRQAIRDLAELAERAGPVVTTPRG